MDEDQQCRTIRSTPNGLTLGGRHTYSIVCLLPDRDGDFLGEQTSQNAKKRLQASTTCKYESLLSRGVAAPKYEAFLHVGVSRPSLSRCDALQSFRFSTS